MYHKTTDAKITFLGVTPVLTDETGNLKPQDLVALSALMTFKGTSVKELYRQVVDKGQNVDKRVETIIRKSSLRGHASIATTPTICFTYEASKFVDSLMTGMIFSSSLMASGRRTNTTPEDIAIPTTIDQNKSAKELYLKESTETIIFFNSLLEKEINKDEASKILQYGIKGTGIIAYPIESIIAFKKEMELQGDWMPEEAKIFIEKIEKELKKNGVELIYTSRELAARNVLPYPNIFKDPNQSNMARELVSERGISDDLSDIVDFNATITKGLEKKAKSVYALWKEIVSDKKLIKKRWRENLSARHELDRDYYNALQVKVLSAVSWRVWGDKKRHRTVPMTPDSIYFSIDRCRSVFEMYRSKIEKNSLNTDEIKEIDRFFTIPPVIYEDDSLLYPYLARVISSLESYFQLIEKYKVKPSDAIFIMPRGIRIDLVQSYDLHNLISGYYPLRTCSTAEAQLRPMALKEMAKIKNILIDSGLPTIAKLMMTKCNIPGFCLEEKNCPIIEGLVKGYTEEYHEELKQQLDNQFAEKSSQL